MSFWFNFEVSAKNRHWKHQQIFAILYVNDEGGWCTRHHPVTRLSPLYSQCSTIKRDLAWGRRAGNLNWPIRIQQAGKTLLSWRQCKFTGKALKPGNFCSLEMALNIHEKGITIVKTLSVFKMWKIWRRVCLQVSNLAPNLSRRRLAWQLARSSSSVAR